MTPTRKGLYPECEKCSFQETGSEKKYPCSKSHKEIRKASGQYYERNFTACGIFEQK